MNFALSDEQELLKEAARGALSRFGTVAAARDALDGAALPDLWPTAVEAGWPGLLVSEDNGGAGLSLLEASLVFEELGRVLASTPLLGHLPASLLLDRAGAGDLVGALAAGATRGVRAGASADGSRRRLERRSRARLDARPGARVCRRQAERHGRVGARRARCRALHRRARRRPRRARARRRREGGAGNDL